MKNTLAYLTARSGQLPVGENARLQRITALGGDRFVVAFSATPGEELIWTLPQIPEVYQGGSISIDIHCAMATGNSGNLTLNVAVEAATDLEVDSSSFDSDNTISQAVPATPGEMFVVTVVLTNKDSLEAGDTVRLKVARGSDSTTGTLYVLGALLYETVSTVTLSGGLNVTGNITAQTLISTVASGTAPFTVASNTVVTNLNAEKLGGYNASSFVLAGSEDTNAVILAPGSSSRNTIQPTNAAYIPLIVKGFASQSANLQEWQDSTGTILTRISSGGDIVWGNRTGYIGGATWGLTFSYSGGYLQGYFNFGKYRFNDKFTVSQAMNWSTDAFNTASDVGIERSSTAILKITNASTGYGSLICGPSTGEKVGLTVQKIATKTKTVNNVALTSNVATLTTSAAHGFVVGESVVVSGLTNSGLNGTYTITVVGSTTTFSYAKTASNITSVADSGTAVVDQSANIQEWQKSDGTVLTKITKDGWINYSSDSVSANSSQYQFGVVCTAGGGGSAFKVYLGAGSGYVACQGTPILVSNSVGLDRLTLGEYHTGYKGLSLDEAHKIWFCDVYGNSNRNLAITKSAAGILKLTDGSTGLGSLICGAYDASTIGLTVKGAASQSASLQEWQNSSGTALSHINSSGEIVGSVKLIARQSGGTIGTDEIQISHNGTDGIISQMDTTSGGGLTLKINSGEAIEVARSVGLRVNPYGNGYRWQFSESEGRIGSGVTLGWASSTSVTSAANDVGLARSAAGILKISDGSTGFGSLTLGAYSASTVGLTVKGYTSQSASLQEWQNSSGTALARITSAGRVSLYNGSSTYFDALYHDGSNFSCRNELTAGGSYYGNSSGSNVSPATIQAAGQNILRVWPNGIVTIASFATGSVPLTLSGFSGQTGNLQEWQKSDGTLLTKVTKDGWINYSSDSVSANSSQYQFGVVCTAGGGGSAFKVYLGAGSGYVACQGTPILVSNSVGLDRLTLGEYQPGYKGLSLDEAHKIWFCDVYNNSNRNLAITKSAAGILKLTDGSTGLGSLICGAYSASTIGLTVKGYTSQSANIQEWQNSSGTVIASVNSAGSLSILPTAGTSIGTPAFKVAETGVQALMRYYNGNLDLPGTFTQWMDWGGLNRIGISSSISGMRLDVNHKIFFGNTYLGEDFNIALTKGNHGIFNISDNASRKGSIVCGSFGGSTTAQTIFGTTNATKLITTVALTSNVATITTSGPHTFQTGQRVVISGLTNSGLNGTYTITNIPSITTFKFDKVASNIVSVADSGYAAQTQTADLTQWKCGGSGAKFVAASSQVLSYGTTSLNADADMTIAMWINPIAASTGDLFFVGTTNQTDGFRIYFDSANNRIAATRGSASIYVASTVSSVPSGCWTHVVVTYVASSGLTQIYINGVASSTSGNNTTSVGTKGYKLGYSGSAYYNGGMDAVGIWNKVLTTSDIASLFSLCKSYADLNASETTSLHAWYDFASSSTLLTDSGGNSRTLTNTGTVTANEGITSIATRVDSSGNLVMGAASSGAKIDITGPDATKFLNITDGYGTIYVQYGQVVTPSVYAGGQSLLGSVQIGVNADAGFARNAAGVVKVTNGSSGLGSLLVGAYSASTIGLTVKGFTSQSANLQEWKNYGDNLLSYVDKAGNININPTALAYAATTDIDFNEGGLRELDLSSDVTFTTSHKVAGKSVNIKITSSGGANFTFPAWRFIGSAAPTSLAAGKVAMLNLICFGGNDTDIVAAYAAEV